MCLSTGKTVQELIDAMPLPAIVISKDGRLVAVNELAVDLLGPGVIGRHYITSFRQPSLLDAIDQTMKDGQARQARFLSTEARRDKTWRVNLAVFGAERSLLMTLEDQTATEEAGMMRRDFVANVSHELRTPLTALIGFIETLRGAAKNDPEAQARFLEIMDREAARMNRLVEDLMSLNRVEATERVRPSEMIDVSAVARSVAHALEPLAQERGMTIVREALDDAVMLPGDADQLAQVFTNLVENALKYSGSGETVTLRLETVENHPMTRGPAAVVSVKDTGAGFDPSLIPRLTERFYRIDSHRSRELGGTGLGLAIVKHIINRHRGRLRIESTPGQGADFAVILPIVGVR
ncbi:MAG: two-component sensor histidine kinase [Boseongicola sp.]|nr:two-component sensor histidine kinase [Boseongicola sp.]NNJ68181.1 two-component sensor histidine kinase [Boseongicola sp.]